MELNENFTILCNELKLPITSHEYHSIASTAAKENWTYAQFLNEVLEKEVKNRLENSKKILIGGQVWK